MSHYDNRGTENNRDAPFMVPNLSTQSNDSAHSFQSSMSSVGGFSSASPNTNFSYAGSPAAAYDDNTYNDQYDLEIAQYPNQNSMHHLEFCGTIPTNTWLSVPSVTPPGNYTNPYPSGYADTAYQSPADDTRSSIATYSAQPNDTVHTVRSLGWPKNTPILNLYEFVNKGKDSFFELIDRHGATSAMPLKVFLSDPNAQGPFPCEYPADPITINAKKSVCQTLSTRTADLERHYNQVHTPIENRSTLMCDRNRCDRKAGKPFGRKDHYRDHLRDYHKEDLGRARIAKAKNGKPAPNQAEREKIQRDWVTERVIISTRWRCIKCLRNNKVSHGYICGNVECKMVCERERQETRMRLAEELAVEELRKSYLCNTCSGSGFYSRMDSNGVWDDQCPDCRTPEFRAPEAEVTDSNAHFDDQMFWQS